MAIRSACCLALIALAAVACGRDARPPADLILANGIVHTFADSKSSNEGYTAIAVSRDRIVYLGDDTGARA